MKPQRIGLLSIWFVLACIAAGAAVAEAAAVAETTAVVKTTAVAETTTVVETTAVTKTTAVAETTAAADTAAVAGVAKRPLRRWLVGVRVVSCRLDDYQIFGREDARPRSVADADHGLALHFGYRFGRRFLLQLDTSLVGQELGDGTSTARVNLMFTGTVLFRVAHAWQPYVVGGLGSSGIHYQEPGQRYRAVGVAAEFGGGFFVLLSSLVALDVEVTGNFFNWKRVDLRSESIFGVTEEDWSVRTSSAAVKFAIGLTLWF